MAAGPPSREGAPSVAFLTHTSPLPAVSGERIRSWSLMRELVRRGWRVSLFGLLHGELGPGPAEQELLAETCAEVVLVPLGISPARRRARLLRDLLTSRAFQSDYFFSSRAAARSHRWVASGGFHAIVVGQLYMARYVPEELEPRAVLDAHNSEARRIGTMARALGRSPRGIAARLQQSPVARLERKVARAMARVVAVSDEERDYFESLAPGRVDLVPNGIDCTALRPRDQLPSEHRLLFVGSLDYGANVDAVWHLVDDVLPLLGEPDVVVDVVGSNPRRELLRSAHRRLHVNLVGYVADTDPYWGRARVFVVPLRVGGGTRLKILEALARGVPVVSTSIGCEGLRLTPGEELLVADDPADFAAAVRRLLHDDELCRALAGRGRATVERLYDWRTIGAAFERTLRAVAGGDGHGA